MTTTLKEQVAIVTGGSRGIGRAISVALAAQGAYVYVNYSASPAAAEETVKLCHDAGGNAEAIAFDVASSESVDQAFEKVKAAKGRLDILVNNAGIAKDGLLMRFKNDDWERTMSVNLDGSFYCARAASKIMMRGRYGRIINISSVVGEMGNAGQSAYVASKAGLIGLTKSMARELASRNITVNAVTPGFIETDMTAGLDPMLKAEHLKTIPLERYGQASDIAAAVSYLASPDASYVTGQILGVNGGMYM